MARQTKTKQTKVRSRTTKMMTGQERVRALLARSPSLDILEEGERSDPVVLPASVDAKLFDEGFSYALILFGPSYGYKLVEGPEDVRAQEQAEGWMAHAFTSWANFERFVEYVDETRAALAAGTDDAVMVSIYVETLKGTIELARLALEERKRYERHEEPFDAKVLAELPALVERSKATLERHGD